ncbi:MAG: cytochrome C oxidase subunit IV family protein [Bacteroidota bacterium]
MGTGLSYEDSKKKVVKGFFLLLVVTLAEVAIALVGKGHIIEGFFMPTWLMYLAMISLSIYKAYYIVNEFMHMGYEVRGLALSVLLPLLLLVWAIIAFLWEGSYWGFRREYIKEKNEEAAPTGMMERSHPGYQWVEPREENHTISFLG